MWLLYARFPVPDARLWPGRRWLALVDALVWPGLVAVLVTQASLDIGLFAPVILALCAMLAVRRCVRAVWRNERYRFTTWRLAVPMATLLAFGALLKLAA